MNDRVVKNPNFKNNGEFYKSLMSRGAGVKGWPNTHTEVEHLGGGKFAASIGVGHRVFFDKNDNNKPKQHKLTDERPAKDYVLIQGAKCCVEVYPYYAKYFDVQHEEVRLYEESWVCQRLFKESDTWRDVDAYNPQIVVEEYSEPAGDVVKVTVTYDTDYGVLTVEYFQRDGNALKHNVSFKNTSGSTETFRVLQRWAGIVGNRVRCNGKLKDITQEEFVLSGAFDFLDGGKLVISENQAAMFTPDELVDVEKQTALKREGNCIQCGDCCNYFHKCPQYDPSESTKCKIHIDKAAQQRKPGEPWDEWRARRDKRCRACFFPWKPERLELTPNCGFTLISQPLNEAKLLTSKLQPVNINTHTNGLKASFIFADWILARGESLIIDPDTATLDNPTEDGYLRKTGMSPAACSIDAPFRESTSPEIHFGGEGWKEDSYGYRGYVEWPIGSLAGTTLTANPVFKYEGELNGSTEGEINPITEEAPSGATNANLWDYIASGIAYVDPFTPVIAPGQSQDLEASAKTDLQTAIDASQSWFAIGFQSPGDECLALSTGARRSSFSSEERTGVDPKPTLYVEYTPAGWTGKISGVTNPAKIMGVDVANIAKVKGVVSA